MRLQIRRHPKRGESVIENITLVTNLLDVPAEVIALVYQHRWTIEVYQPDCTSSALLYKSAA